VLLFIYWLAKMQSIFDNTRVIDVVGASRPLVSVSYEDTISSALKKLEAAQVFGALVHSGPVIVGVIDMKDIAGSLVKFTRSEWKDFSTESAKNLADESKMFGQQVVGGILNSDTSLVRVTGSSPLCEAIAQMVDGNKRRLVAVDGLGKIVNIISQFDVIKFLYENISEFDDACDKTVAALSLGTSPVICAPLTQCAAEVFQLMISRNFRSLGIVNNMDDLELVANLSLSDLKCLSEENFKKLSHNVFDFLLNTQETPKPVVCCSASTTLEDVISLLAKNHIHRVYVVDRYQHPCSVISLVDILKYASSVM